MNIKAFFVTTLSGALDLGLATCDDVLRHVTPDVLSAHLPRPLWSRLLVACVGAPRVDAVLVVETIGVPNLCEHIPVQIMWACIEEIGVRVIGGTARARIEAPVPLTKVIIPAVGTGKSKPVPLSITPPPDVVTPLTATQPSPTVIGPDIPAPGGVSELLGDTPVEDRPTGPAGRGRTPAQQRFRASSTGIGRLAAGAKRPQATAAAVPPPPPLATGTGNHAPDARRPGTESEYEVVTNASPADDWKNALAVEDEQLIDWSGGEETTTGGNNPDDASRKR